MHNFDDDELFTLELAARRGEAMQGDKLVDLIDSHRRALIQLNEVMEHPEFCRNCTCSECKSGGL